MRNLVYKLALAIKFDLTPSIVLQLPLSVFVCFLSLPHTKAFIREAASFIHSWLHSNTLPRSGFPYRYKPDNFRKRLEAGGDVGSWMVELLSSKADARYSFVVNAFVQAAQAGQRDK